MADKIRADVALVQQQLCESRERAQAAIMEGRVFFGEKRINKPSETVDRDAALTLKTSQNEYVSRGALKLEKAIRVFGADLKDRVVMDIGASTGGFTDICLRN
ncbi:MAG: TlyA family rRNA (cytidine-2'-O)-methyltransferase, partial [Clostridia bacterium]|nr:TlyA family rRNA (cytidine-2'-O)-methyltransferase [Clostridia bacterium]